jgi:ferric-dicitrate binding protein FerR (iron transport regulator)
MHGYRRYARLAAFAWGLFACVPALAQPTVSAASPPPASYARTKVVALAAMVLGAAAAGVGLWLNHRDGQGTDCVPTNGGGRVCLRLYDTAPAGWASLAGGSVLLLSGGVGLLTLRW